MWRVVPPLQEPSRNIQLTFDDLYTNLVVAGEEGGILDTILTRLANYIEKAEALKKKVKSALVYPSAIVGMAVIVVAILMIFVIPVFETMFKSAGQSLPLPTLIVVTMSKLIKKYVVIIIPGVILFFYLFKKYYKTESGKTLIDRILLKLPVFGILFQKSCRGSVFSNIGNTRQQWGSHLGRINYCLKERWK